MFLSALNDYGIQISNELERKTGAAARIGPEELLDACTRTTYKQPIGQIIPNMGANLGQDFMDGFHRILEGRSLKQMVGQRPHSGSIGRQGKMEVGSLLNP